MKILTLDLLSKLARIALGATLVAHPALHAQTLPTKTCHLPGMRDAVQCGSLTRPLNPEDPKGKQVDIHVAIMPSKAREKLADPIYLLAGGPGQSAMDLIPAMQGALSRLNNRRDLVFVDQRGTGKSAPLECERETQLGLSDAMDPGQLPVRMAKCRAALEKLPHGDLRYYSTTIAMQDLDAVRAALGQERINLVGASYGTRTALEYLRLFPQRVRRMVIDGVAPASMSLPQTMAEDANAAWKALATDCAADTD
ncbi:MAG: cysteine protease, partial [Burkholderiales bacterium PBB4]